MKCFKNVKAYVWGKGVVDADISFNERISSLEKAEGEEIVLPQGAIVLPAFIDEHIHGAGGCDAMDGTVQALKTVSQTVAKEGTARFLATTMTQSPENILKAMHAVKEYMQEDNAVLGIHLEGPFISPKFIGAQPPEYVATPSVEQFKKYNEASGNAIKIVTLAPEEEGAQELVKYLSSSHIVPSIGHTNAKCADISEAIANGAGCVTHTYNAQSALHHREIGTVGSAMLFDELYTELIADGIHVSVPAMKLLVKSKPKDKLVLITDAMRAKGLSDGVSELGGQTVYVKGGEARLANGALAGSVLQMNDAVKNLVEKVGVPFTEAVDCATINPAKQLGIDSDFGSISVGKMADFVVLDSEYAVLMTIRGGKVVYEK